ncbi:MAG: hypothetical protein CL840_21770 [Crocinitomicaceae bacterium]|nr:hypothetical protein [Crocinitomicaceae bacterium]
MDTKNEIIELVKQRSGYSKVNAESDIFHEVGMVGDDFHELIEEYAEKYQINMDDYLWYFHADEEGQNFGGLFFKPPYDRVERIPITPNMLAEIAVIKKWNINYPEHTLPKYRYDLLINAIFGTIGIGIAIFFIVRSMLDG